jgi:hypothetical protein
MFEILKSQPVSSVTYLIYVTSLYTSEYLFIRKLILESQPAPSEVLLLALSYLYVNELNYFHYVDFCLVSYLEFLFNLFVYILDLCDRVQYLLIRYCNLSWTILS